MEFDEGDERHDSSSKTAPTGGSGDADDQRAFPSSEMLRGTEREPPSVARLSGSLSTSRVKHFKNRLQQLTQLRAAVSRSGSLTQVCGRGGAGKTAIVTKLLLELRDDDRARSELDGVVYLSLQEPRSRTVDHVVELLHPLLPPADSEALRRQWAGMSSLDERLGFLFGHVLGAHRILVVLDNCESAFGEDDRFQDGCSDLQTFIESGLDSQTAARMLLASRRPLALPPDLVGRLAQDYLELSIDAGLPDGDGVALLRELDTDGRLGFRRADEDRLRTLVGLCHGIPRVLESLAGTLRQHRTWNLDRLLADRKVLNAIIDAPAQELYGSMNDAQRAIMRGLAVYEVAVPTAALRYLGLAGQNLDELLEGLVRNYAVYYDDERGRLFSLHPIDQAFIYTRIPDEGAESKTQLHTAAAAFYAVNWDPKLDHRRLEELEPQLQQFSHLVRAGLYDIACRTIDALDQKYLLLWGHAALVLNMRKQLEHLVRARNLEARNLEGIGDAYLSLGEHTAAVEYMQGALSVFREVGDRRGEARVLHGLSSTHLHMSDFREAVDLAEHARTVAHEVGDRLLAARTINNAGSARFHLDDLHESVSCFEEARAMFRELGERRLEGRSLAGLGMVQASLSAFQPALSHLNRAVEIFHAEGDRQAQAVTLSNLAFALVQAGDPRLAIKHSEQALAISRESGDKRSEGLALENLGTAHLALLDYDSARSALRRAFAFAHATGERLGAASALDALGRVCHGLSQYHLAMVCWVAAYITFGEVESPRKEEVRNQLSALRTRCIDFEANLLELTRTGDVVLADVLGQEFSFYSGGPSDLTERIMAILPDRDVPQS